MKNQQLLLIGLLVWQFIGFAQNPFGADENPNILKLYVSKQTGEFTFIQGTYTKVADEFEDGTCAITKSGPIVYTIDPAPDYGPSSSTTWTGLVKPDVANCPAPGTTNPAALTGDYSVHYSKPGSHSGAQRTCNAYYVGSNGTVHDPHGCGGTHTIVPDVGSNAINYEVISILIDAPDTIESNNMDVTLTADIVYPGQGTIVWNTPAGQLTGSTVSFNYYDSSVSPACKRLVRRMPSWSRILNLSGICPVSLMSCFGYSVKYSIEGVSYSDEGMIKLIQRTVRGGVTRVDMTGSRRLLGGCITGQPAPPTQPAPGFGLGIRG